MDKDTLKDYCINNFFNKRGWCQPPKIDNVPLYIAAYLNGLYPTVDRLSEQIYLLLNNYNDVPKCPVCNSPLTFKNYSNGYTSFCSKKCTAIGTQDKRKQTVLKKYRVESTAQIPHVREARLNAQKENKQDIQRKREATYLKKYGTINIASLDSVKNKRKETNVKRYGVENIFQSEDIKKDIKDKHIEKYGVENISQSDVVKEKKRQSYQERYGVDSPLQNDSIIEKVKQTNMKLYGATCVFQSEEIKEKIKNTNKEKYGVNHPLQLREVKQKNIDSYYLSFYKKLLSSDRLKEKVTPLFTVDEYKGRRYKYQWQCNDCGNKFEDDLDNGHIPRCPNCYPSMLGKSHYEEDIIAWLKELGLKNIIHNDRDVISPLELDVYLPDYNLAIEFNGLYWHSELQGKGKDYHNQKTQACEEKGIHLIQIFEDEWIEKEAIVKSIVKSYLGVNEKIYARKCVIKEIKDPTLFLENNHLQGSIYSKVNLGLYYDNELVSLLSFSSPRFNKGYDWEITRFVNKIGYSVIGAFGKLLKYFGKLYSGNIITYSDRRYFKGDIYKNNGFSLTNITNPNYYYTDYFRRYNRMQFQKHKLAEKLEKVDKSLTEWQNMQINGYDRIWDCGNYVYTFN